MKKTLRYKTRSSPRMRLMSRDVATRGCSPSISQADSQGAQRRDGGSAVHEPSTVNHHIFRQRPSPKELSSWSLIFLVALGGVPQAGQDSVVQIQGPLIANKSQNKHKQLPLPLLHPLLSHPSPLSRFSLLGHDDPPYTLFLPLYLICLTYLTKNSRQPSSSSSSLSWFPSQTHPMAVSRCPR